jgi:hypothetical protein
MCPRVKYGPRECELLSSDNGADFAPVKRFTCDQKPHQVFEFAPVTARTFRLRMTSAFDPFHPDAPRSAQICEMALLDRSDPVPDFVEQREPILHEAGSVNGGTAMRVSYHIPHGCAVTQFVGVTSEADDKTVYVTAFRANRQAIVELGSLFPMWVAAPPGFEKPVRQYRGANWLNMSDHLGFVSAHAIPDRIPSDRFYLTNPRKVSVNAGEWFGHAALVLFVRQPHTKTASLAQGVKWVETAKPEVISLRIGTDTEASGWTFDFSK